MKQLIINADDFGLSPGANRAIIAAWQHGILTSTSLMVGGGAFDEAVALARSNPGLQVGLHLTLVQGRGIAPVAGEPSLLDAAGNFTDDPVQAGMRYFFSTPLHRQLAVEIEAQIRRFLDTGLPLSHIDGHLNIHMHPVVFSILQELMPRYGITSFRLTRERLFCNLAIDRNRLMGKILDAFIFGRLARHCRPKLDRLGIACTGEVKGLLNSGAMAEEYLLRALDSVQDGVTEIYFHPGCLPCDELQRRMPTYHHEGELAALTSRRVRERLLELKITLRNYRGEVKSYV